MVANPGLAPIFSVPLLISVPLKAGVALVPRLSVPPISNWPLLVKLTAPIARAKVAPDVMTSVPALAVRLAFALRVPVSTVSTPLLTKLVGWMVVDPVSNRLPLLMTLAAELS